MTSTDNQLLCHSTTWDKIFLIWKSGALEPQVFEGSEHSTCSAGCKVIFTYKCECKRLCKLSTGDDVVIVLPPKANSWVRNGVMRFTQKFEMPEFYLEEPIPLEECRIYVEKECTRRLAQVAPFIPELGPRNACCTGGSEELSDFIIWLLRKTESLPVNYGQCHPLGLGPRI